MYRVVLRLNLIHSDIDSACQLKLQTFTLNRLNYCFVELMATNLIVINFFKDVLQNHRHCHFLLGTVAFDKLYARCTSFNFLLPVVSLDKIDGRGDGGHRS